MDINASATAGRHPAGKIVAPDLVITDVGVVQV
jgi:hypothetical protein